MSLVIFLAEHRTDQKVVDEIYWKSTKCKQCQTYTIKSTAPGSLVKLALDGHLSLVSPKVSGGPNFCGISFPYDLLLPLLFNCSNSLTTLHLNIGETCAFSPPMSWILQLNLRLVRTCFITTKDSILGNNESTFTLSILLHLECLTIRAEVDLDDAGTDEPPQERRFYSPIPAIQRALKTISSPTLRLLKIEFYFIIESCHPLAQVIWAPLLHLVAESSFPCVNLNCTFHH